MSEKQTTKMLGDIISDKLLPCTDLFYFPNPKAWKDNAKATFVRTKNVPIERDDEGKVTKWGHESKSFYEFVTLPVGLTPADISYRETTMIISTRKE